MLTFHKQPPNSLRWHQARGAQGYKALPKLLGKADNDALRPADVGQAIRVLKPNNCN